MGKKNVTGIRGGSPDRFGYSWEKFSEYSDEQEKQFVGWVKAVGIESFKEKDVLDVGCGAGRNSFWAIKAGAAKCTAIDIDKRSLEASNRNLRDISEISVEKRSAYEIGYEKAFDIAFSIGVIHHLEFPLKALKQMREAVRPGGRVLIWVYGKENMGWYIKILNPLRKLIFSKLPLPIVRLLAWLPTLVIWAMLRMKCYKLEYFKKASNFPISHLHHVIFDQMLPRIANYWSKEQVNDLMMEADLKEIKICHVNEMSWSAVGEV